MIEVNNFDKLANILDFDGKSVYIVWLVRRNKDGNTTAKGNNKNRTIKSYFFQDKAHFDERREEIIQLCKTFNCRAYMGINKKPMQNILCMLQNNVTECFRQLLGGQAPSLNGIVDGAVMKAGTDGRRKWIVDVDDKDPEFLAITIDTINDAQSSFDKNVLDVLPTAHGYHLVTHPFDVRSIVNFNVDVKKEGLTLLYAYLNE